MEAHTTIVGGEPKVKVEYCIQSFMVFLFTHTFIHNQISHSMKRIRQLVFKSYTKFQEFYTHMKNSFPTLTVTYIKQKLNSSKLVVVLSY